RDCRPPPSPTAPRRRPRPRRSRDTRAATPAGPACPAPAAEAPAPSQTRTWNPARAFSTRVPAMSTPAHGSRRARRAGVWVPMRYPPRARCVARPLPSLLLLDICAAHSRHFRVDAPTDLVLLDGQLAEPRARLDVAARQLAITPDLPELGDQTPDPPAVGHTGRGHLHRQQRVRRGRIGGNRAGHSDSPPGRNAHSPITATAPTTSSEANLTPATGRAIANTKARPPMNAISSVGPIRPSSCSGSAATGSSPSPYSSCSPVGSTNSRT